MSEAPYGLIELGLVFGLVLAAALWELRRNKKALARTKEERDKQ